MLDKIFSGQLKDLQQGLNKASMRHGMLSNNVANVNVPGYKRKDMDFSVSLEGALGESAGIGREYYQNYLSGDNSEASIRVDGNNVDMEYEVMSVAETELRFQALSDMTANYFNGLKNVIREGR